MPSKKKQKRYNYKMSKNTFNERTDEILSNENTKILCLTHCKQRSKATAHKAVKNYIRRINYLCKKRGLPNCKYICVTSDTSSKSGKLVRVHHHIILSCELSREEILSMWNYGRININELQGEKDKFHKLCEYLKKNTRSGRRWISSLNLKKPLRTVPNDNKYTSREIEKLAKAPLNIKYWERKYPGWTLINTDDAYIAEYNELTGWSIYLKLMRIKDTKKEELTKNTVITALSQLTIKNDLIIAQER